MSQQRRFEIIPREGLHKVKLTIAKERVTVKFPPEMSIDDRNRYIKLAHAIDKRVPEVKFTIRGNFHESDIELRSQAVTEGQRSYKFQYSELEV